MSPDLFSTHLEIQFTMEFSGWSFATLILGICCAVICCFPYRVRSCHLPPPLPPSQFIPRIKNLVSFYPHFHTASLTSPLPLRRCLYTAPVCAPRHIHCRPHPIQPHILWRLPGSRLLVCCGLVSALLSLYLYHSYQYHL